MKKFLPNLRFRHIIRFSVLALVCVVMNNGQARAQYDTTAFIQSTLINFQAPVNYQIFNDTLNGYHVAIGDIDGDGKMDIVTCSNKDDSISIYRNIGSQGALSTSSFASPVKIQARGSNVDVKLADIDGDGKLDIVVASHGTASVSLLRNTTTSSSITFASYVFWQTFTAPGEIVIADFDGDGKKDIAVVCGDQAGAAPAGHTPKNYLDILLNNTVSGSIGYSDYIEKPIDSVAWSSTSYWISLAAGDIDGDNKQDIVVSDHYGQKVRIYSNSSSSGTIAFTPHASVTTKTSSTGGYPFQVALADLNGDNRADLLVCEGAQVPGFTSSPDKLSVYRNLNPGIGTATASYFGTEQTFSTGIIPVAVTAGDFSGDGYSEIVVSNSGDNTLSLFRNTSTGTSAISLAIKTDLPIPHVVTYSTPVGLAIGDFDGNGNGIPDLAVITQADNIVHLYRNAPVPQVDSLITGADSVCIGATTTLSNTLPFSAPHETGQWGSFDNTIATVDPLTGVVTGVAAGTDTIYRYVISLGDTATLSFVIRVLPGTVSPTISGPSTLCAHDTATFSNSTPFGTWSVTNPRASIDTNGLVTGLITGIDTIHYTITGSCGAGVATKIITIDTLPVLSPITGITHVAIGGTTTLSDASGTGTWAKDNANVNLSSTTGSSITVTGMANGTSTVYYSQTNGCGTDSVSTIISICLPPSAGTISGTTPLCPAATATYTIAGNDSVGTWLSSNTSLATVNPTTGFVTAVAGGIDTILYALTTVCGSDTARKTLTVTPLVSGGTISGGTTPLCPGGTTTLTDGVIGGAWSSLNMAVATVDASGVVTAVAPGSTTADTATIVYTVTGACNTAQATKLINVNPLPNAGVITGADSVCGGVTTAFSTAGSVGTITWASSVTAAATVTSSGATTASVIGASVTAATSTIITATATNSCGLDTTQHPIGVRVTPVAGTITGGTAVCETATLTLADATGTAGGTWSSSNTAAATVNATTGVVTGVSSTAGAVTISYTVTSMSCGNATATQAITVNPAPNAGVISGADSVCSGSTTTLTDAGSVGTITWSSSTAATTVSSTGVVTAAATTTITSSIIVATATNSCGTDTAQHPIGVRVTPASGTITGGTAVCETATLTLADATGTAGGTWSSNNTAAATVNATSGVVTGVSSTAGAVTISYTVTSTSCGTFSATQAITVNPAPNAGVISGADSVCSGSITTLTDAGSVGTITWSSSTAATTVSSTGVVTAAATTTITSSIIVATATNSCGNDTAQHPIGVKVTPDEGTITGTATVCVGSTTTLADATGTPGGTWSSDNTAAATVNATTGVVTGVSATAGAVNISYTASSLSCGNAIATQPVTVNPAPDAGAVTGPDSVCVGSVIALTNTGAAGAITWTSTTTADATVDASGNVTGVAPGSSIIYTTFTNSCGTDTTQHIVYVNALADTSTGITGASAVCRGTTTTLSTTATGGAWTSSDALIASVDASGVVSGVATGTATISYTVGSAHCGSLSATHVITVNDTVAIAAITGPVTVCAGSSVTLADATAGGTWSVTPGTGAGSITSAGVLSGTTAGTVTVSYSFTSSCGPSARTQVDTVKPLPNSGTLTTSLANLCVGGSPAVITQTGGTYTSGAFSIASGTSVTTSPISTTQENVFGASYGTSNIIFTGSNSCGTALPASVSVNVDTPLILSFVSTHDTICIGVADTIFGIGAPAGTSGWLSSDDAIATAVGITGSDTSAIRTGVSTGTFTITYSGSNVGCGFYQIESVPMFVNPDPATAGAIFTNTIDSSCIGFTVQLGDTTAGATGVWSSTNPSVATVDGTGLVHGVSAGSTVISYTISNICGTRAADTTFTVVPVPVLTSPATISPICDNGTVTYLATSPGATFTWVRPAVTGIANTADSSNTPNISESLDNTDTTGVTANYNFTLKIAGCQSTAIVSVLVLPTPTLTSQTLDTVCSGPYSLHQTSTPFNATYAWSRAAITNIIPATASGTGDINDTLINTDPALNVITVTYVDVLTIASGGTTCTSTENVKVLVDPAATTPHITTHSSDALCSGTYEMNFGAATVPPAPTTYSWSATNAEIWATGGTTQYALVNFTTPGTATIYLNANIAAFNCPVKDSFVVNVSTSISDLPQVVYYNNQLVCLRNDQDTYQWGVDNVSTLDSTIITDETNQFYHIETLDLTNNYYWVITTHGGCMQKSYFITPAGVTNVNTASLGTLKVYPNPASNVVNIEVNGTTTGNYTVDLHNMMGQQVASSKLTDHKAIIDVSSLPSGIYFADCYNDGVKVATAKFVKN